MTIDQAREDAAHLMNVTDMIAIARQDADQRMICGEPERAIQVAAAYYGGFNTASDTRNFDRVRGQ